MDGERRQYRYIAEHRIFKEAEIYTPFHFVRDTRINIPGTS